MAVLIALTLSCAERDPNDLFAPESGTIVVDAFLVVNRPFPEVLLSQTLAPNRPFSPDAAALPGATVQISGGGVTMTYGEAPPAGAGRYLPEVPGVNIQPNTLYRLEVIAADGRRVRASTLTPRLFTVDAWVLLDNAGETVVRQLAGFRDLVGDSVYTHPPNQLVYTVGLLEARFDPSQVAGFQVGLASESPGSPIIIDPDFIDDEDLADLPRVSSSPPLETDGTVRLPWFAIFFEGKYTIALWAMDRNWFDLARTEPTFSGGGFGFGGLAGDNFERPIFHVEGGIGLFGSGAADSTGVTIYPRP